MRWGRRLVVLAVLAASTTACSQDADEAYCDTLREEKRVLDGLAEDASDPGADVLTPALESLQRLQEAAPSELRDEYTTVVNAYEGLVDAVEEAGVDPGEVRRGRFPEDLDPAMRRLLRQTATELAAPRVTEATAGIEDHALQVCNVDLDA